MSADPTIGDFVAAIGWIPTALIFVGVLKCAEWAARLVFWCLDRLTPSRRPTAGGSE